MATLHYTVYTLYSVCYFSKLVSQHFVWLFYFIISIVHFCITANLGTKRIRHVPARQCPYAQTKFIKTWLAKDGVKELGRPAQRPDLNPTEYLWHELECWLHARYFHPTSVNYFVNALVDEQSHISKSSGKPFQKIREENAFGISFNKHSDWAGVKIFLVGYFINLQT